MSSAQASYGRLPCWSREEQMGEVIKAITSCNTTFVVVDGEGFPHSGKDEITELGVACWDTAEIDLGNPGFNACEWISKIRTRHLRFIEHGHLISHFVEPRHGHPLWAGNKFHFGRSEWVTIGKGKDVLTSVIFTASSPRSLLKSTEAPNFASASDVPSEYRPVILVGHTIKNEDRYFRQLGITLDSMATPHGPIIGIVDTQVLLRTTLRPQPGLDSLCREFNIPIRDRHCGGNDAGDTAILLILHAYQQAQHLRIISLAPSTVIDARSSWQSLLDKHGIGTEQTEKASGQCNTCTDPHHIEVDCKKTQCFRCLGLGVGRSWGHSTERCLMCSQCHKWRCRKHPDSSNIYKHSASHKNELTDSGTAGRNNRVINMNLAKHINTAPLVASNVDIVISTTRPSSMAINNAAMQSRS